MRYWDGFVYLEKHSAPFWRLVDEGLIEFDRPNTQYPSDADPRDSYWVLSSGHGRAPWEGGDYTGSTASEFANHRDLLEDYGAEDDRLLVDDSGSSGYGDVFGFQVHSDFGLGHEDHANDLVDVLLNLRDEYPLYHEETEYEVIEEWALKAWESFMARDFAGDLENLTGLSYDLTSTEAYNAFRELCSDQDLEYPYAEAHEAVIFPGIDAPAFMASSAWALTDYVTDGGYEVCHLTDLGTDVYGQVHLDDWNASHPLHAGQTAL